MKLVVGLGNPGSRYHLTLHNAGFWTVDTFLARNRLEATKKKTQSLVAAAQFDGWEICFAKPQTFMNVSGEAVAALARRLNAEPPDLLVVHDEADLEPGRIQLKFGGGTGGHNGLESVVAHLGSSDFHRIRLGIGKDPSRELADYVLDVVPKKRMQALGDHGADALELVLRNGPARAIQTINSPGFQRVVPPVNAAG